MACALATACFSAVSPAAVSPFTLARATFRTQKTWLSHRSRSAAFVMSALEAVSASAAATAGALSAAITGADNVAVPAAIRPAAATDKIILFIRQAPSKGYWVTRTNKHSELEFF